MSLIVVLNWIELNWIELIWISIFNYHYILSHLIHLIDMIWQVLSIPTALPIARRDNPDAIFRTKTGKLKSLLTNVMTNSVKQRPILIGTTSIENSEEIYYALKDLGLLDYNFHWYMSDTVCVTLVMLCMILVCSEIELRIELKLMYVALCVALVMSLCCYVVILLHYKFVCNYQNVKCQMFNSILLSNIYYSIIN